MSQLGRNRWTLCTDIRGRGKVIEYGTPIECGGVLVTVHRSLSLPQSKEHWLVANHGGGALMRPSVMPRFTGVLERPQKSFTLMCPDDKSILSSASSRSRFPFLPGREPGPSSLLPISSPPYS